MSSAASQAGAAGRTLGLFAKDPRPRQVKTRLAAASSPAWAAAAAAAFLHDTIERLSAVNARRVLAFAPLDAEPAFAALARGRFALVPQEGADLGQRMAAFFGEQFDRGASPVVLVGTDSPTLPLAFVEQAFAALERADVVLGPATDGGYYLVGCARRLPGIFDGISWGTSLVLEETVARLPAGTRLGMLLPWYDVDTIEDWQLLRGHVAALRRAGLDPGVPHVEGFLNPSGR
jgi:rSAM/selenodomain-associated transferase 1